MEMQYILTVVFRECANLMKSSATYQGPSGRCKTHGGGRRCDELGCDKQARDSSGRCKAHGGMHVPLKSF